MAAACLGNTISAWAQGCAYPAGVDKNDYYLSCDSTTTNWGRTFADQTVTATTTVDGRPLSVTTSTALAGAVVSIRLGNHEFIHSGGHGAAVQYVTHDSTRGECFNPTEGGARSDDPPSVPGTPPFHQQPSNSYLYTHTAAGQTISTSSRMTMWLKQGESSAYCLPAGSTASYLNQEPYVPAGLSNTYLTKTVDLTARPELLGLNNIITFTALVDVQDPLMDQFDGWLIFYLTKQHLSLYEYNPNTRVATPRDQTSPGIHPTPGSVFISCADSNNCFAMIDDATATGRTSDNGYFYVGGPDSGDNHSIQSTYWLGSVGQGGLQLVTLRHYAVVGSLSTVQGLVTDIYQRLGSHPLALSRYFNASPDVYSHWVTTGVPSSGYSLDGPLGFLAPSSAGAVPLYGCSRDGTSDHFLSLTAGCEGYRTESIEGYVYTSAPPGSVSLYRCRFGTTHFASTQPKCEGQVTEMQLGYLSTNAPLSRWFNDSTAFPDHWSTTGGPTQGYRNEEIPFGTLAAGLSGTASLYGCLSTYEGVDRPDHFLSRSASCEGFSSLGVEGSIYTDAAVGRQAIYRCRWGQDHFISIDPKCEGFTLDGLLGYLGD
jgi:hypothetical protein